METNRRQFMILAGVAMLPIAESQPVAHAEPTTQRSPGNDGIIDVGNLSDYGKDGVYANFRDAGIFVIRRNKQLFAISSVCTHRGCKVRASEDESFVCRCHGSKFDKDGHVTSPPAKRDLARLAIAQTPGGRVLVDLKHVVTTTGATSENASE